MDALTDAGTWHQAWILVRTFGIMLIGLPVVALLPRLALIWVLVRRARRKGQPDLRATTYSDGTREVVHIEMSHVGPQEYYDRVRELIRQEGAKGATYLYEGMGKGRPGDWERLMRLIGVPGNGDYHGFLHDVGRLCGWTFQPQASFMGLTGKPDVHADLDATAALQVIASALDTPTGRLRLSLRKSKALLRRLFVAPLVAHLLIPLAGAALRVGPVRRLVGSALRQAIGAVIGTRQDSGGFRKSDRPMPGLERILHDHRDRFLASLIDATPGRLVITYGQAHGAFVRAFLAERGDGAEISHERLPFEAWPVPPTAGGDAAGCRGMGLAEPAR